jgi:hypothetical protein
MKNLTQIIKIPLVKSNEISDADTNEISNEDSNELPKVDSNEIPNADSDENLMQTQMKT